MGRTPRRRVFDARLVEQIYREQQPSRPMEIRQTVRVVGTSGRSVQAVVVGCPVDGSFSSCPAGVIAGRIRRALTPPDRMPELRRRLRELRGE